MSQIKITQIKGLIDRPISQKRTIKALGFGKGRINRSVIQPLNPQILGMINKVNHLVKVEQL
jgi:large subunit ribosomal protein L30